MRILHVATLFTLAGEFGGPVQVAVHQARSLAQRGHTVTVAGAARDRHLLPAPDDGVRHRFFPARRGLPGLGVAGLSARGLPSYIRSRHREFDIAHIHLARDLVTLPAALAARHVSLPYVVQCHGMIGPSTKRASQPLDRIATVPLIQNACRVLTLTEDEEAGLIEVCGSHLPFRHIDNGVPEVDVARSPTADPEVLFLARLHPRKRPVTFVRAAAALLDNGVRALFTVAGPDGGEADAVDDAIRRSGHTRLIRREPAVEATSVAARLARAAVYVLPSVDEPFPLSVLEALSVATPVIITDTCGLADVVRSSSCGIVVDDTGSALVSAMSTLLADPATATRMGVRGRALVRERFSLDAVAEVLDDVYAESLAPLSGERR